MQTACPTMNATAISKGRWFVTAKCRFSPRGSRHSAGMNCQTPPSIAITLVAMAKYNSRPAASATVVISGLLATAEPARLFRKLQTHG